MTFTLWSVWHYVYMLSSFAIFTGIYFSVKNRSEKVKNTVGIVLGAISIFILVLRNVDIFIRSGWDHEVIPLQVCHIGSVIAGLALITRKKVLLVTSFCFHLIPAFLAMLFADSLANYSTLLAIRPQTYVWGHIFIVVCALYGVIVLLPELTKRDLMYSIAFIGAMSVVAIICNSAFRVAFQWNPNYFYLYDYSGTPLRFLYDVFPPSTYGWFTINWFYVLVLFGFFIGAFVGMFFLAKLLVKVFGKQKNKKEAF